ncbi:hypothetical protein GCM10009780_69150 [Actinomadura alba]
MKIGELESKAEKLLDSLLYELDIRSNLDIRLERWPGAVGKEVRTQTAEARIDTIRFPQTKISSEIATLFRFAASAQDNLPIAFLSYYQVLESHLPLAGRIEALKRARLEMADPRFDKRNDRHLMRLLSFGEMATNASEAVLLRTLLREFVRDDVLHEFFSLVDWGSYFTKKGPISGVVDNINPANSGTPLPSQVADRVYRIRNRIVHTKDDPKYEGVPALLPQSFEAESLWPDVRLVRLLASEVILGMQSAH